MDLEEWEVLPEDGSLQTHDDGGKHFFTRKYNASILNSDLDMNYFVVNSSQKSQKPADQTEKQLVETDQETVSRKQFVDMKIEYPKFSDISIYPRIDNTNVFEIVEKGEANKGETMESKTDSEKESENEISVSWEEKNEGKNIWKKSLSSGVGAICWFGIAVAIIILGSQGDNKHRNNQKIRFQICSDEKRLKQVVHNVVKLDEAFTLARDVLSKAHITTGCL